jgi:UDP-glucuronate 4-epimerase
MRRNNITKLIFASSSSVYGNNSKVPFSESDIVDYPISPYAASKKAGELLCHTYHHLYNFDIYCLRFFTVYGLRQRPDLAINKFTKAIIKGEAITLFGDGSSRRDYTYIADIIQGINAAIQNLRGFDIFNLGESQTISLKNLVSLIEKFSERNAKLIYKPMQDGDVFQTYADISKAKDKLGYKPHTNIETGIEKYIRDFHVID